MDDPLDKTTLATISLLESRLLRIEHLLYGTTASPTSSLSHHDAALEKMDILERRFNNMVAQIRVYAELLKICQFIQPQPQPAGSLISKFQFLTSIFLAQTSQIQISSMLRRLLNLPPSSTRKQSSPSSSPQHRHSPLRSPPSPLPKISPSPTLLPVPLSYLSPSA